MSLNRSGESVSLSANVATTVAFAPSQLADFVVHYDNTAFHVHKFVLHHHSACFGTYIDTLAAPSFSFNDYKHAHIAHCIHLPSQATLVEQKTVTADDTHLFFRHLYFAAYYCYPPFLLKTVVKVGDDLPPPISLQFPSVQQLSMFTASTPLRLLENGTTFDYHESLLTLAHYLDCGQLTQQCEAVMLTASLTTDSAWLLKHCWYWLPYAIRYKLDKVKAFYIATIAADKGVLEREEYKKAKLTWENALLIEILEAVVKEHAV